MEHGVNQGRYFSNGTLFAFHMNLIFSICHMPKITQYLFSGVLEAYNAHASVPFDGTQCKTCKPTEPIKSVLCWKLIDDPDSTDTTSGNIRVILLSSSI